MASALGYSVSLDLSPSMTVNNECTDSGRVGRHILIFICVAGASSYHISTHVLDGPEKAAGVVRGRIGWKFAE